MGHCNFMGYKLYRNNQVYEPAGIQHDFTMNASCDHCVKCIWSFFTLDYNFFYIKGLTFYSVVKSDNDASCLNAHPC